MQTKPDFWRILSGLTALCLQAGGCKAPVASNASATAKLFSEPPLLQDLDPRDGHFEGQITAAQARLNLTGEPVDFLAYNGTVPGPLIRVQQGDSVSIDFANDLPGGAEWASGVHWHGIEGFNASDGTPITQVGTLPGASFHYAFDATRAGLFWYHPHVRGAQALFSGLFAPLVVVDPDEPRLIAEGILPADERVMVLSDTWTAQGIVTSAEVDDAMEIMNGTEGQTLLVNGMVDPVLEVVADSAIRLRLVNASITRFWRLSVPGQTLYRVGGGGGLLERVRVEGGELQGERFDVESGASLGPATVDQGYDRGEILLAPGERADVVLVTAGAAPGDEWPLFWRDVARGRHDMSMGDGDMGMGMDEAADDGTRPQQRVARIRIVEGAGDGFSIEEGGPILAAVGRQVTPIDDQGAIDWFGDDGTTLDEEMMSGDGGGGSMDMQSWLGMNGESWHPDAMGGPQQPLAPSAHHATLGQILRWEIRNNSAMAHPYHLHGFSYQPYARVFWPNPDETHDGSAIRVAIDAVEYQDTTLLPAWSSLLFLVELQDPAGDGSAAGRWVQHCHILQHGENGMMSELVVAP